MGATASRHVVATARLSFRLDIVSSRRIMVDSLLIELSRAGSFSAKRIANDL